MSNSFDTEVYQRRKHTPWATVSFLNFVRAMVENRLNGEESSSPKSDVIFTANYRPDVSTHIWFSLEWTGEDGERHSTAAQDFGLLLWRAAEIEMKAREKKQLEKGSPNVETRGSGFQT